MNEKFLEAFKNLESELRSIGTTVLDYENSLEDSNTQEKLKLCRITRNYLAHQDKKFIVASKEMIDFINNISLSIRRQSNIVANEMIKPKSVIYNEYLKNILPLIVKNYVPVVDKSGKVIYIIDDKTYLTQLNNGFKRFELPKKLPALNYTYKDEKIDNLSNGIYVVTSTGDDLGKYIGLLIL